MTKKVNNKKSQPKKPHLCHHYGASRHTRPNCYKWSATEQSNSMLLSGNQNQFPSSLAPFGDLLKALVFLSNLNGFKSSPSPPNQRFTQRKGSSKVWKEKRLFLSLLLCLCITCIFCFLILSQFSFMICFI